MKKSSEVKTKIFLTCILIIGISSIFFLGRWTFVTANQMNDTSVIAQKPNEKVTIIQEEEAKEEVKEKPAEEVKEEKEKPKEEAKKEPEKDTKEDQKKEPEEDPRKEFEEEKLTLEEDPKIAYLTFDDGPSSKVTPLILDILKTNNIKATFFVIGIEVKKNPEILLRIKEEGHEIANHSYSHNYKTLYSSTKNFLEDIQKNEQLLKSILGESFHSKLIRMPGGSYGKRKATVRKGIIQEGYHYLDWNVVTGDAEGHNITPSKQLERLKETLENKKQAIVLMHDTNAKGTTVEALPKVIEYLQKKGYVFKTLNDYKR